MKKFHLLFISFLVCLQSVVFAEDERSDESDNEASQRGEYRSQFDDEPTTEEPVDMVKELKTNLGQIQKFARNVKPVTNDIRHTMHSRRSFNEENFFNLLRMGSLKLLNTAERFAPVVQPILKIPRNLVHALLEE